MMGAEVFADPVLLVVAVAALGLLAYVVVGVVRWRRQRRARRQAVTRRVERSDDVAPRPPVRSDEEWEERFRKSLEKVEGPPRSTPEPGASAEPEAPSRPPDGPSRAAEPDPAPPPSGTPSPEANTNGSQGRGTDSGTVELLPGRLEPVQGYDGYDVRFVRHPHGNRFTLGRQKGNGRDHIQIGEPTVSRVHAAMEYADGQWLLSNRSETNPVHLNGAPVSDHQPRTLGDGDRIDMGQVAFIFRQR